MLKKIIEFFRVLFTHPDVDTDYPMDQPRESRDEP